MADVRLGIALGGGGAKGLAHVVMLEAIDELGLRPCCVTGTSMGAIIGVLYCAGMAGREIRDRIEQLIGRDDESLRAAIRNRHFFKWLEFIEPQIGGSGLFKTEQFLSMLFEPIEAKAFEELAIPLRVVTADFWSRDEIILDRGPLRPAIQASMSLPGLFSPVVIDDRMLVDGGAVNPVPFDALPAHCTLTGAIDTIGKRTHAEGAAPSLSDAIFNTFQIMEKSIVRAKLKSSAPDLYVEVELLDVRLLEFHKAHQIFAQAERGKDDFKRELERQLSDPTQVP